MSAYDITVVKPHRVGSYGLLKVSALTREGLEAGILEVFSRYPVEPYGTGVLSNGQPYESVDGMWSVYIQHWGSD